MMHCDAVWLNETLRRLPVEELSPLLNLGSSTRAFREVQQPYIHELVFKPLLERGVRVIHSDIKAEVGVDLVCNIFEDEGFERLKAERPRAVLCTHMLEHIVERDLLAARLMEILPEGGLFIVTVPSSYHEHHDPIDTMYRPTPEQLAGLFQGHTILEKAELEGHTYWTLIRQRPLTLITRHVLRGLTPFLGLKKWRRSTAKLYWLFHPYKVSAVLGRKRAAA